MKNVLEWYLASNTSIGRGTEKYPEGAAGISVKASRLAAWIIWKMEGGVWQNLRRNIKNREHTSYAWGSRILSSQYWMTKLKNAGWQDRILSEVWSWAGSLRRNMRSWSTAKRSRHFSLNTERSESNLNQIARYFNSGGERSLAMREELERTISELYSLRKEVLKLAGGFTGSYQAHKKP